MNELERQVLRILGENVENPDVFGDITPVRRSINDAIQDLCAISKSYRRTYLLPLYAGRQVYRLAPQYDYILHVVSVYDRADRKFLEATSPMLLVRDDPRWMEGTGPVDYYMNLGFNLFGIYRIPAETGRVLELTCACLPSAYTTDKAAIRLNTAFQQAAVDYAASEVFASRGDAARAAEHLTRFTEGAKLLQSHPLQADRSYRYTGGPVYAGRALQ